MSEELPLNDRPPARCPPPITTALRVTKFSSAATDFLLAKSFTSEH